MYLALLWAILSFFLHSNADAPTINNHIERQIVNNTYVTQSDEPDRPRQRKWAKPVMQTRTYNRPQELLPPRKALPPQTIPTAPQSKKAKPQHQNTPPRSHRNGSK